MAVPDRFLYPLTPHKVVKCVQCEKRPRVRPGYEGDQYFLCPQCAVKLGVDYGKKPQPVAQ